MLKNYLRVAFRNLWRNKLYAFICIFGLALGISCATLVYLFVSHEWSYDQFHENKDRLYRVTATIINNNTTATGKTSLAVGPALREDYPEVETFVRMMNGPQYNTVFVDGKTYEMTGTYFVDSAFFSVFSFRLLEGDPLTALAKPNSIVITQDIARKYFGDQSPVGKTMKTVNNVYTVTGVSENTPSNSDIEYSFLISMNTIPQQSRAYMMEDWFYIVCQTYILFRDKSSAEGFQAKLDQLTDKYVKPWSEVNGGVGTVKFDLQPITTVHLDNTKQFDTPKGNPQYIYVFGMVGIFIILIACINYVNLSLSQSLRRAKEVGVRKTLGGYPGLIVRQFLGESLLITFLALVIGLVLVELLLPSFNQLSGKSFTPVRIFSMDIMLFFVLTVVIVGLLSGAYPALVLSRFHPVTVLRGILPRMGSAGFLRKMLVVVQFVFSASMLLGTVVVFSQMQFLKHRSLGFDKGQVMVIQTPQDTTVQNRMGYIRQEMARINGVSAVSLNGDMPGYPVGELLFRVEQEGKMKERGIKFISIDENFLSLMNIEIVKGRNLDPAHFPTDSTGGFIINETAARQFGWDDPVGKRMQWGLLANDSAANDGKVIAVVKDFNFASMHNPIEPLVMFYHLWSGGFLALKINSDNPGEVLKNIEAKWREVDKIHSFKYDFLDERIHSMYQSEEKMLRVFGYFAMISILIASMGLFALTSYSAERRTREIGIRKVLGASHRNIAMLISKEFIVLVGIAFLLAIPLGYYFLDRWLQDFAYRVPLHPVYFLFSAIAVMLVAFLALSYSVWKAGRSNPVRALKYE